MLIVFVPHSLKSFPNCCTWLISKFMHNLIIMNVFHMHRRNFQKNRQDQQDKRLWEAAEVDEKHKQPHLLDSSDIHHWARESSKVDLDPEPCAGHSYTWRPAFPSVPPWITPDTGQKEMAFSRLFTRQNKKIIYFWVTVKGSPLLSSHVLSSPLLSRLLSSQLVIL